MKFDLFQGHYSGTKLFFPRGEIPGYRHTQRAEIHLGTLLVKGERKGERSGYRQHPITSSTSGTSIYPLRQKGKVRGKQRPPPRGQARPDGTCKSYGGRQGPVRGQAETPTRWAETLTLKGANQDIKESGHQSRRPPTHKGYNQFIKDARRSQRASQLSQLKPMEGKI